MNVSFIIFKTTCLAKQGVINFVGFPCSENFSKVPFHILIGVFENTKVFIIHLKQPFTGRGGGASLKLGAQITDEPLKSGCAKPAIHLIETQKVGAQMRTLAH